jgi:hypothetical protein
MKSYLVQFTISLIRELRGSPLTILVACILLEQSGQVPITAQLLKDVTGYRDHTITDSLRALESPTRQLVTRVTGGWRLTEGFQLPLELSTGPVDNSPQNREYRGFGVSSSPSLNKSESFLLEEEEEGKNRKYRGFANPDFNENHKLLRSYGVGEPKATQLANLHHVTPDYIQAHFAAIKDTALSIGTAIHRIEHQWTSDPELLPLPPQKPKNQTDGRRYSEGEFAEYINH